LDSGLEKLLACSNTIRIVLVAVNQILENTELNAVTKIRNLVATSKQQNNNESNNGELEIGG